MKVSELNSYNLDETRTDESFIRVIEDHMSIINQKEKKTISIKPYLTNKYKGNFYGLLLELGVEVKYHYATMRVNGMSSPTEYIGSDNMVSIVNENYIDHLYSISVP